MIISPRFQYCSPNDAQLIKLETLRKLFTKVENEISTFPPSRELSVALTKLEEAAMWANKAVTHG